MTAAVDEKIQQFLSDLMLSDNKKYILLQSLRKLVLDYCPTVSERMMYGGIMFSLTKDFGGLFVYKNHLSFEFGQGATFDDPDGNLEGQGKLRRHVKLKNMADIDEKQVVFFVKQAIEAV